MNTLTHSDQLDHHRLLSVVAHPDDLEMHHSGIITRASYKSAIVASDGEGSTLNYTDQSFHAPDQLARARRLESERALAQLGLDAASYSELPDGLIGEMRHSTTLVRNILRIAVQQEITAIATLGEHGYCGHVDHIATHRAALIAKRVLADNDIPVQIFALNHHHTGQLDVAVQSEQKLAAIANNATQFKTDSNGRIDTEFWRKERAQTYDALLERETFDVIQ